MEESRFQRQVDFLLEIDALKSIVRQNYLSDGSRRENDVEHSWHLAMMVVVLAEYFERLDVLKTVKMVMIHDIVEIYAGDTFAYDIKGYEDKDEREQEAAERIFSLLPVDQMAEYKGLWEEFEKMESPEAVCASIADRVQPLMMNYGSGGRMWRERKVTADMILKRNRIVLEKAPQCLRDFVKSLIRNASEKGFLYKERGDEQI